MKHRRLVWVMGAAALGVLMFGFGQRGHAFDLNAPCWRWNDDPDACRIVPGCEYDPSERVCRQAYVPDYGCERFAYDSHSCDATPGCRFNPWNHRCEVEDDYSWTGWCAGNSSMPSFMLATEWEAQECAWRIAQGGYVCRINARYGRCDSAGFRAGWQREPWAIWCSCDTTNTPTAAPVRWTGSPRSIDRGE